MGVTSDHATNVPLVLDPSTGSITPKFHVIFDDQFNTVTAREDEMPDFNSDAWYKMFGDSVHQYHVDESLEPQVNESTVPPEQHTDIQSDMRAWASDIKYSPEPITSVIPSRVVSSLDPPNIQPKTALEIKKEPSKELNTSNNTSTPISEPTPKPIKQEVTKTQPSPVKNMEPTKQNIIDLTNDEPDTSDSNDETQ